MSFEKNKPYSPNSCYTYLPAVPPDWSRDMLSKFMDIARSGEMLQAISQYLKQIYVFLQQISLVLTSNLRINKKFSNKKSEKAFSEINRFRC